MPRPVVRFTLGETAATTPYQSKIGGTPYLPKMRDTRTTPRKSTRSP